jgi:glucosamine-6-phosphate deaminase
LEQWFCEHRVRDQRADDRTRGTAELYDKLGMDEYEAIEAFVRWEV